MALVMINIVLSLTGDCFHNPSGKGRIPPRIGYTALVMTVDQKEYIPPPVNSRQSGGGDVLMAGSKKPVLLKHYKPSGLALGYPNNIFKF